MTIPNAVSPASGGQRRAYGPLLLLTLLMLLAAFSRLYHLMGESVWVDEGYTYYAMTRLGPLGTALDDMHPPLYYFGLGGFMALGGDTILVMRAFSALLSILAVPLFYQMARRMVPQEAALPAAQIALLATLLFVLSDPDISMAQEARNYSLHKLTAILSMWLYLRWAARPGGRRLIAWVAASTAMIYTYYLSAVIMAAQGLHALLYLRGRLRWTAIGGLAISGLLFLPWFLTGFLDQIRTPNPLFLPEPVDATALGTLLRLYFSQQWALVIGLIILGVGVVHYAAERFHIVWRPDGPAFMLIVWLVTPFALLTAMGSFSPRWPFLVTPAIALLAARGLGNLRNPGRFLLAAVLVVYGVTTVDFYWPKPPWDRVAGNVVRYAEPGEPVLMEVNNDDVSLLYYLEHMLPPGSDLRSMRLWREATTPAEYHTQLIDTLYAPDHNTLWVAAWGEDHDLFTRLENAGYRRTMTMTTDHVGNALNVHRYDRLPEEPAAVFQSGMALRQVAVHPAQSRVDLWWSADTPLETDYTTSVFLLDESGQLVAQHDSFPQNGARPTTSWMPGEVIYDPHLLAPADLPPGRYTVAVQVYTWQDGVKVPTADGQPWFTVGVFDW